MRSALRWLLGVLMILVGASHFVDPAPFDAMIPPSWPSPRALVLLSGFFEVLGGAGLLIPRLRRAAGYGLVALYIAVFPANVYVAMEGLPVFGRELPALALWLRLPFQLVFIAWALYASREPARA
jgi:uncharacterized membrane protein